MRIKRFKVGDRVIVSRATGGFAPQETTILDDTQPAEHPDAGLFGGNGRSAQYRCEGYDHPVYDAQLDPVPSLYDRTVGRLLMPLITAGDLLRAAF